MSRPRGSIGRTRKVAERNYRMLRLKCGFNGFGQNNLDEFVGNVTEYFAQQEMIAFPEQESFLEDLEGSYKICLHNLSISYHLPVPDRAARVSLDVLDILLFEGRRRLYRENTGFMIPDEYRRADEWRNSRQGLEWMHQTCSDLLCREKEAQRIVKYEMQLHIPGTCFDEMPRFEDGQKFISDVMTPMHDVVVQCLRNVGYQMRTEGAGITQKDELEVPQFKVYEPMQFDRKMEKKPARAVAVTP